MTNDERHQILDRAKNFFKEEIFANHIQNTKKLKKLSQFNINPFLSQYLSYFLTGNNSPESIARALVYPRVLGTSINTTFGNRLQQFCSSVLNGYASMVSGIDIEFIDQLDGRKKYCQVKAGPNTINKDDVKTIIDHFGSAKNLARTNHLQISLTDFIVGVFYGEPHELSGHYRQIDKAHPVHVGKQFWHRLTGHEDFYHDLIHAVGEVASEGDGKELLEEIISELAHKIASTENK